MVDAKSSMFLSLFNPVQDYLIKPKHRVDSWPFMEGIGKATKEEGPLPALTSQNAMIEILKNGLNRRRIPGG